MPDSPIVIRCVTTEKSAAVATIPSAAPIRVPKLNEPCNAGRNGLPEMASTSAPSTFSAISLPPMLRPNNANAAMTNPSIWAAAPRPMRGTLTATPNVPNAISGFAPSRANSGPEQRIPAIAPSDRPKITIPICAVEAPSKSRIAGVRVTQDDIARPGNRNNAQSAKRRAARVVDIDCLSLLLVCPRTTERVG